MFVMLVVFVQAIPYKGECCMLLRLWKREGKKISLEICRSSSSSAHTYRRYARIIIDERKAEHKKHTHRRLKSFVCGSIPTKTVATTAISF